MLIFPFSLFYFHWNKMFVLQKVSFTFDKNFSTTKFRLVWTTVGFVFYTNVRLVLLLALAFIWIQLPNKHIKDKEPHSPLWPSHAQRHCCWRRKREFWIKSCGLWDHHGSWCLSTIQPDYLGQAMPIRLGLRLLLVVFDRRKLTKWVSKQHEIGVCRAQSHL